MHRFQCREILPDRNAPKISPLFYNSWEAILFDVNEEGQIDDKLVEKQEILSGSYLANHGISLNLGGDFDCTSLLLERTN